MAAGTWLHSFTKCHALTKYTPNIKGFERICMTTTILWFRRNLRLCDNDALISACESGGPVVPVYIADEELTGGASRWWLHHSLQSLDESLRKTGSQLVIREGEPSAVLARLAAETGATRICCARRYEPRELDAEARVLDLESGEFTVEVFDDQRLHPESDVRTGSGSPYKIFTPFWRASTALGEPAAPRAAPVRIVAPQQPVDSLALADLELLPTRPDWAGGLRETWIPGEDEAHRMLDRAADVASAYGDLRDRPDKDSTTRLSPYLHFGEVSPRQVWHAVVRQPDSEPLLRQLYWREFSTYLLRHFPSLPSEPLRPEFEHFPWVDDSAGFEAWTRGRTGYPIVDAGMRQLWETGWMHNRVRMIAASFLVKDLLIPWQMGAAWFMDTLVDADLANNSASWQWVAGCGTDSAPFFRIFNPLTQAKKFDPDGAYASRWLSGSGSSEAPEVTPIVDHGEARRHALAAYQSMRDLLESRAGESP